jgi:hypothetical protein
MAEPYSEDLRRRAVGTIELVSASGQHETSAALKANRAEPSSDALRSICEAIRAHQANIEPQPPAIDRFK